MIEIVVPLILVGLVLLLIIMLIKMTADAAGKIPSLIGRWRAERTTLKSGIGRSVYQSSGKVRWTRFLPCVAATLLVSTIGAAGLHGAYLAGCYYFLVLPVFAAVPVMVMVCWTVSAGHCRNRRIGW